MDIENIIWLSLMGEMSAALGIGTVVWCLRERKRKAEGEPYKDAGPEG